MREEGGSGGPGKGEERMGAGGSVRRGTEEGAVRRESEARKLEEVERVVTGEGGEGEIA